MDVDESLNIDLGHGDEVDIDFGFSAAEQGFDFADLNSSTQHGDFSFDTAAWEALLAGTGSANDTSAAGSGEVDADASSGGGLNDTATSPPAFQAASSASLDQTPRPATIPAVVAAETRSSLPSTSATGKETALQRAPSKVLDDHSHSSSKSDATAIKASAPRPTSSRPIASDAQRVNPREKRKFSNAQPSSRPQPTKKTDPPAASVKRAESESLFIPDEQPDQERQDRIAHETAVILSLFKTEKELSTSPAVKAPSTRRAVSPGSTAPRYFTTVPPTPSSLARTSSSPPPPPPPPPYLTTLTGPAFKPFTKKRKRATSKHPVVRPDSTPASIKAALKTTKPISRSAAGLSRTPSLLSTKASMDPSQYLGSSPTTSALNSRASTPRPTTTAARVMNQHMQRAADVRPPSRGGAPLEHQDLLGAGTSGDPTARSQAAGGSAVAPTSDLPTFVAPSVPDDSEATQLLHKTSAESQPGAGPPADNSSVAQTDTIKSEEGDVPLVRRESVPQQQPNITSSMQPPTGLSEPNVPSSDETHRQFPQLFSRTTSTGPPIDMPNGLSSRSYHPSTPDPPTCGLELGDGDAVVSNDGHEGFKSAQPGDEDRENTSFNQDTLRTSPPLIPHDSSSDDRVAQHPFQDDDETVAAAKANRTINDGNHSDGVVAHKSSPALYDHNYGDHFQQYYIDDTLSHDNTPSRTPPAKNFAPTSPATKQSTSRRPSQVAPSSKGKKTSAVASPRSNRRDSKLRQSDQSSRSPTRADSYPSRRMSARKTAAPLSFWQPQSDVDVFADDLNAADAEAASILSGINRPTCPSSRNDTPRVTNGSPGRDKGKRPARLPTEEQMARDLRTQAGTRPQGPRPTAAVPTINTPTCDALVHAAIQHLNNLAEAFRVYEEEAHEREDHLAALHMQAHEIRVDAMEWRRAAWPVIQERRGRLVRLVGMPDEYVTAVDDWQELLKPLRIRDDLLATASRRRNSM